MKFRSGEKRFESIRLTCVDAELFEIVDPLDHMFELAAIVGLAVATRKIAHMNFVDAKLFIRWQWTMIVFPLIFI